MKLFLIVISFYSANLLCGQNEDFNKYKKVMLEKCQSGSSESCKSMGTLIDVKSDKHKMYDVACAEDISDACYKLAKTKNKNTKIDKELTELKGEAAVDVTCDKSKLFAPVKGRYGLNPTLSFAHGNGGTTFGFGLTTEAFIVDQFSLLARFNLGYADSNGTSATSFDFLAGFRGYATKEGAVLPFFQLGGGVMYLSSGTASATAFLISPGLGLLIPINNCLTANIEIDPAFVFNNGVSFYITTTIGIGFWF